MKLSTLSICAMLTLARNVAFAQDANVGTTSITDTCTKGYANSKIDPVRDKIYIVGSQLTDDMLKDKSKPNAIEKEALRVYVDAEVACAKSLYAIAFKDNEQMRLAQDIQAKKRIEAETRPLINGKITYAEYNRRQDQKLKDAEERMKEAGFDHRYENYVEAWLSPNKSAYPSGSPWWGFYNYAIATAKDVDRGKISEEEAAKLIEDKRLKVNEEIAASAAPKVTTLNCPVHGPAGEQGDIPIAIDYTNMKVNGRKADFYENSIRWSIPSTDGSSDTDFTLNRLSGFINVGSDQFPSLMSGYCAPATKKF